MKGETRFLLRLGNANAVSLAEQASANFSARFQWCFWFLVSAPRCRRSSGQTARLITEDGYGSVI